MTPEMAVARLAEFVTSRIDFTEDDCYAALAEAGVPPDVADLAYKFTQIAWGREFLREKRVSFSPEYFFFNAGGEIVGSGELGDQPYFVAARRMARMNARSRGFAHLALMSSDVQGVNAALNAGSKPENLMTSPAVIFLEAPTPAGREKATQFIQSRLAAVRQQQQARASAVPPPNSAQPEDPLRVAKRMLAAGAKVPQIEQALIERGVDAATAAGMIDKLLQSKMALIPAEEAEDEKQVNWTNLILGLLLAGGCFVGSWIVVGRFWSQFFPLNAVRGAILGGIIGGGAGGAIAGLHMARKELMHFLGR
jgi:hypothetical protein